MNVAITYISLSNPCCHIFLQAKRNLKKEQQLEDRYATIEHENRLLLGRMSDIMAKPTMDTVSTAWQYGHSLNHSSRRKELLRITGENQVC